MKRFLFVLLVVIAILAAGCAPGKTNVPQTTGAATGESSVNTEADKTGEANTTTQEETHVTETTGPENTEAEQTEPADTDNELDDYMASLKAQSDAIKASLEQDSLSQSEMNQKAQELYVLWDNALNDLWGKLQDSLSADEFDQLLDEQIQWIEDKEDAVEEAGKEFEGGSLQPLITNSKAAEITETRVYEFYELLKQA